MPREQKHPTVRSAFIISLSPTGKFMTAPSSDIKVQHKTSSTNPFPVPLLLSTCLCIYFLLSRARGVCSLQMPSFFGGSQSNAKREKTPLGLVVTYWGDSAAGSSSYPRTINNLSPSPTHKSLQIFGVNSNCCVFPRGHS